ncbi:MAG TPA: hypothetical protein VJS47_00545 [Rhizomicrobium sp.]|nr:hypothetical protein [Rhizomicrobium sp.]
MANDRTVRSLSALEGASSSRVLNLIAIADANAENENHGRAPLFVSKVINNSIILKHRLRADETDLFSPRRAMATKIIIPFERTDLKFGGRSLFIAQRGFEDLLQEVGNYRDRAELKRDLDVLKLIDAVPSLDPFLLREHLRCNDIRPDACYFAISPADQQRMHDYAAEEVSRLTALANGAGKANASTNRMVSALLSNEVNEKLEPLRATLSLGPAEFAEGVFSWRGFIYYKWCLDEYWPNLIRALKGIKAITPIGKVSVEERRILDANKNVILQGAKYNSVEVRKIIAVYDNAYAGLIERQDPKLFREFLLGAPKLFLDIGDKMGALSHITSFWNYRFPSGAPRGAEADELVTIFQDFTKGLAVHMEMAA